MRACLLKENSARVPGSIRHVRWDDKRLSAHSPKVSLAVDRDGKLLACHMGRLGRRTAVVERRWIGGSCPNIACLPSQNEIWSARVAHLAHNAAQFGTGDRCCCH
jgi:hypothetical protein